MMLKRRRDRCRRVIGAVLPMVLLVVFIPVGMAHAAPSPGVSDAAREANGVSTVALEGECEWEGLDDRCESWEVGGAAGPNMAVNPAGTSVFTWGDERLSAHDLTTGDKLWEATLDGLAFPVATLRNIAVSPDGERVYAVGDLMVEQRVDIVVATFDAASGDRRWSRSLGLPAIDEDENDRYVSREQASTVAVSPDGRRVYVVGDTRLFDTLEDEWITNADMVIAGYDAASGTRQWVTTWADSSERFAEIHAMFLQVSPDNRNIYVGGTYAPCGRTVCRPDYLSLGVRAYQPAEPTREGLVLWDARYDGFGSHDSPTSMELAPDGSRLYMTGLSAVVFDSEQGFDYDWATVAYDAATGAEEWVTRFDGPDDDRPDPLNRHYPDGRHSASDLAVSPDGEQIFVTGTFEAHALADVRDFAESRTVIRPHEATLAYDADSGEQRWATHLRTTWSEAEAVLGSSYAGIETEGRSVTVSPDGQSVYVLGQTQGLPPNGQTTVSYDSGTGAQHWIARSSGEGAQVAAHPDGTRVYALSTNGSIRSYEASP